ncbi:zinc finger BED domain-containing protein RICESLEEPER 2-like [Zingiber officinale]|uniref:zinc finger BED domain-containing protein RICESLEEPER 2-like n=1 Tax=Zingiber officinale TaxID=94328 RepID=UPI001C4AF914|nr:zinc finger BED domain-containing protein RICESLEEPER 2-like [Zingiber officinale]
MTSVAADASPSTDVSPSAIGMRKLTSDAWNHFRRKKSNGMDKAICNYCENALSGNMEHHGFRKLLASLQPLFKGPCRNTIKSDILKMYDYEKTKVLSLLECNKVVQDSLDVIAPIVEKIHESVAYWRASPKREQKFDDAAWIVVHNMNVKKLVLDCKPHWNSTYLMFITAISFKDVFTRLRFRDSSYKCFPTDEWLLAEEWVTSPNKVISSMVERMLSKFEKYWSNIHGIMGIATILDPRYKSKLVEYCFKRTQGEIGFKEPLRRIQKMCYDLLEEYTNNNGHASVDKRSMETRLHTSTDDFLDSFDKEVALKCDINTDLMTELDHYLEDKMMPRNVDFDILEWWKTNGTKYPNLMRLARDILAIQISTVASESTFSTSGRLVSSHRSRLHLKTIETLMCAQSWLSNEKQATSSQETKAYYSSVEYYEDTINVDGIRYYNIK